MEESGQIYFDNLVPEEDRKRLMDALQEEREAKLSDILIPKDDDLDDKLRAIVQELKTEESKGSARGPRPTPPPVSERKRIRRDARDARKLNRG